MIYEKLGGVQVNGKVTKLYDGLLSRILKSSQGTSSQILSITIHLLNILKVIIPIQS